MKTRTVVELPGYVTVSTAAERLRLAPRSVRDLVYAGRLPSARLGRRHFLRVPDVEAERRRRLGLPLPQPRTVARARPAMRRASGAVPTPLRAERAGEARVPSPTRSEARRARAEQRTAELERWLRSGHGPGTPTLPFAAVDLGAAPAACDACHRQVRAGGRMVEAAPSDGRPAARLCLTCARRTLLAWSDSRRREAIAARRLAQELGTTYTPLLEPATAA
jgi:excisionase family DNA binding protein